LISLNLDKGTIAAKSTLIIVAQGALISAA